jgi:hypothetical protein
MMLKRLIQYWWENFQHAFHGAVKFLHGILFVVAVVGTISPHFFLTEETMTVYAHKLSIFTLIAYLLWVPYRRHGEKEKELEQQKGTSQETIAKLQQQLQLLNDSKPCLEIHWHPNRPCLERDAETFYLRLQIENRSNAPAKNVRVKLISISPPPPRGWSGSSEIDLPPTLRQLDTIHPRSNIHFNLVGIARSPRKMKLTFGGEESFDAAVTESLTFQAYVLEISASSLNSAPVTERFKLNLFGDVSLTRIS